MPSKDAEQFRHIRAQLARRYIDSSLLEVVVIHGVVYIRGTLMKLRSHPEIDLDHEVEAIVHLLRGRNGIRDIIWEAKLDSKLGIN